MKIKIGILLLCISSFFSVAGQTATLHGMVTDAENGEPIIFGNVAVFQDGVLVTGVETDFDGNYVIKHLDIGVYDVQISYVGYATTRVEGVEVKTDREPTLLNIEMNIGLVCCLGVTQCYFYLNPLIEQDNNTQGQVFTSDQLRHRGRGY